MAFFRLVSHRHKWTLDLLSALPPIRNTGVISAARSSQETRPVWEWKSHELCSRDTCVCVCRWKSPEWERFYIISGPVCQDKILFAMLFHPNYRVKFRQPATCVCICSGVSLGLGKNNRTAVFFPFPSRYRCYWSISTACPDEPNAITRCHTHTWEFLRVND